MPASGGVRLSGGPVLSEAESSFPGSDTSSVITLNERLVPSDTDEDADDGFADKHKYRMPDIGKTRLHLHTKEPLSPTPRQVPQTPKRRSTNSTPTTPKSSRGGRMDQSPIKADLQLLIRNGSVENVSDSDFVGSGLSRAGSIYTLSRVSFAGQLAQLTTMRLPDADSLAKRISSISAIKEAVKALADAAVQIRMWVSKASEVLGGLDAEDDVEWAAAGGRDGVEDLENAITRFDKLVQVYIVSIEKVQTRKDVSELSPDELVASVKQVEIIIASWQKVKQTLKGVKEQVEIAMEWEELWNSVLGEIGQEMAALNRLVFEMEERRHQGAESLLNGRDSIDLSELETIVEERPGKGPASANNRFSLPPFSPSSPIQPQPAQESREDANLLGLFARMQPLRASLDFLPMRLSVFHCRGNPIFPTACLDLEQRRDQLEAQWKKLESDAEALRRELGEDRWVLVFRNAGRQALKMCESIIRSYSKLKDGIDVGEHKINVPGFTKKVENYEAKKLHYGPAIERVLAIIDRGVLDRLTVNGEILRLQSDMKRMWTALQADMRDVDLVLEDINRESSNKQLRDSVSTVMSSERSIASSMVDTPGSSPASSVVGTSRKSSFGSRTPTSYTQAKTRQASYMRRGSRSNLRSASNSSIPRRVPLNRDSSAEVRGSPSPAPSSLTANRIQLKPEMPASNRPRWMSAAKTENRDFLPLSALEPSPYAKLPVTPKTNFLRASSHTTPASAPARVIATRNVSTPSLHTASSPAHPSRMSSLPVPKATIPSRATSSLAQRTPPSFLRPSSRAASGRRSSMLALAPVPDGNEADSESPLHHRTRPPSALVVGRQSSMLPMRSQSRLKDLNASAGAERPQWRH